ncbi:caspase family protein [Methylobacterium dankookense]|uniref:Caspase family p20 domain-containing protein n=1 Tax=Methylobacterium dankookense TaxID=560405 RepID=A0A564FVP7_9HYPH|nr:caspase family protein [Methylobacterium dankookense]GJD58187.1 hypothetical protein IFDJLNFL_4103 [Methylobacterium dankookense]VUF12235.1 hypothetical protein MTDSW087_01924 [Methylobacterium dankookense]
MPSVRILASAFLLMLAALLPSALQAATSSRAALLIANAAYPDSEAVLPTPIADARALGEALKAKGFTVETVENASKEALQAAIDRFQRGLEPDGIAFVYFGGYGIQVARKNYLIPVDARIWSEADVVRDGLSLDGLLEGLSRSRAGIRAVVLDASRRNPFERRFRSFSQGLAAVPATPGSLILSSTAPGGVVNEGGATRSPFVSELVQQIGVLDQTADRAFAATAEAIARRVRGQSPALAVNLEETFSFDPDQPRTLVRRKPDEAADKAAKEQEARDQAAKEAARSREQSAKEQAAKEQATRDQAARDQAARDQAAREQAIRDQAARDQAARDQAARDQAARDQAARDQANRDRLVREQGQQRAAERAFESARAQGTKAAYQDFLAAYPASPLAERARAEVARIEGEDRQATADYERAEAAGTQAAYQDFLDKHPSGTQAERARNELDRIARTAERRRDEERQRLASLDQRIASNPRDDAAYYERGQFHAQRGDAAAAIRDFDQTIRLNPASPEAFNNRCWMRALSNDLQRAMSDCNQALKLRPGFVDALDSRGLVNLKSGALRAAVADYDVILRGEGQHASALYGRGIARLRLGERGLAEKDMAGALELNPQIDKEFAGYGIR